MWICECEWVDLYVPGEPIINHVAVTMLCMYMWV